MPLISKQPKDLNFKFILPLALFYLCIYLIADSVAYKMVSVGIALEPGPPFIFPLSYAIADIIAEVYGYTLAKKLIWLTLLCQLFFAFAVSAIIRLPSPSFWHMQTAYNDVFGNIIRFVFAGSISVLSSSFINVYTIAKWKIMMKGKHFWLRSIGSSAIGGFVLIAVVMIVGYSGTVDLSSAIKMFFSIYMLELVYACITAWPAWMLAGYLKIKEGSDVYDTNTNFNPFNFKT